MSSTRDKLNAGTIALHWVLAISMIGMIAFGLYLEDLPRSPDKGALIGLHKSLGLLVLGLAVLRVLWRLVDPFPDYVGTPASWEKILSKIVVTLLVLGMFVLPLSGIVMSLSGGHPISFFGLFTIPAGEKNEFLNQIGHVAHGLGGNIVIGAILLHIAGAYKHHLFDKDGTLKRILGRRVEIVEKA